MPRTAVKTTIGNPFTELSSVNSTNIYAMEQIQANLAVPGQAYFALEQTAGKGQRGREWLTAPGENILLSVIVAPDFLGIHQQFHLSAMVAVACYDFLQPYISEELSIKWPNDIYWRDRKTGGILIESSILGDKWQWAVVGIGININQTAFPGLAQKAVSLKEITGKEYNPVELARELCQCLSKRYLELQNDGFSAILETFRRNLHKKGQLVKLRKEHAVGNYLVKTVSEKGELVVEAGIEQVFSNGQVEWLG